MASRIHRLPGVIPHQPLRPKNVSPRRFRRVAGMLIMGGLIIFIYWFFFRSHTFHVTQVEVVGIDRSFVQVVIQQLEGRNIFSVNQTSIEASMRSAYPPIESVSIVRGLPHTLRVSVHLRQPSLRWQSGNKVFVLDAQGEAFQEGSVDNQKELPLVIDTSSVPIQVGQEIVSAGFIHFVTLLHTKIPDIYKRSIVRYEVGDTTFHIDAILDPELRLKLTVQRPAEEQLLASAMMLAAHTDAKYIDVRIPTWGYWK